MVAHGAADQADLFSEDEGMSISACGPLVLRDDHDAPPRATACMLPASVARPTLSTTTSTPRRPVSLNTSRTQSPGIDR